MIKINKILVTVLNAVKALGRRSSKVIEAMGKMPKRRLQLLLVPIVLLSGGGIGVILMLTRKPPAKEEKQIIPPLVKVQTVTCRPIEMIVRGYGTVQPKVQAEVVPEVSGKVVSISPDFTAGGFIRAGNSLITIDNRDYELAVQSAEAEVARAEVLLDIEKAEAEVSRQEWEQLHPGVEPYSPLVVREPQIRQAETLLQAAKAQLATTKLALERTEVSLPFDGRVISKSVDLGQYVVTGQAIGKVYSIETVEIEVPLEDRELAWFDIPSGDGDVPINGSSATKQGSAVEIRAEFAGSTHTWHGRVVRTTGQVDIASRLVSVVVEVPEPFTEADDRPPLVPGMFVELSFRGKTLHNAFAVPRYALHNGNKVWVVEEGRLYIKQVEIVRQDADFAYVVSGLEDNEAIILSTLDIVTSGMQVRTISDEMGGAVPDVNRNDSTERR